MATGPGAGGSTAVNIQALNNALNVFSSVVQQVATAPTGQRPGHPATAGPQPSGSAPRYQGGGTSEAVPQAATSSVSGQQSASG
jgi:hypothetical protein